MLEGINYNEVFINNFNDLTKIKNLLKFFLRKI